MSPRKEPFDTAPVPILVLITAVDRKRRSVLVDFRPPPLSATGEVPKHPTGDPAASLPWWREEYNIYIYL